MAPKKFNYLVFTNSNLNVSDELNMSPFGETVGYQIRYDSNFCHP